MDKYDKIAAGWLDSLPPMASSTAARKSLASLLRETVAAEAADKTTPRQDFVATCNDPPPGYVFLSNDGCLLLPDAVRKEIGVERGQGGQFIDVGHGGIRLLASAKDDASGTPHPFAHDHR